MFIVRETGLFTRYDANDFNNLTKVHLIPNEPVDILCPPLWVFGSENTMDNFKEYEESLKKSKSTYTS